MRPIRRLDTIKLKSPYGRRAELVVQTADRLMREGLSVNVILQLLVTSSYHAPLKNRIN